MKDICYQLMFYLSISNYEFPLYHMSKPWSKEKSSCILR